MASYVARRLIALVLVLWFVGSATFLLMHAVPGGPFDEDVVRTKERVANLEAQYGLDEPLTTQYALFWGNLLQGDLGISFQFQDRPVTRVLSDGVATTAT